MDNWRYNFGTEDDNGAGQLIPYANKLINNYTQLVMFLH
jgi:hypothetical protein